MSANKGGGGVATIYIHAGAGFHSVHNEHLHLKACEDAAKAGMAILRNGGTAVQAVEMAIITLEDKEITNAGFGSNLTIDGEVECDATIVNHLGRSGAVGAVSKVKNPISAARCILKTSSKPLTLARVPPNFLVGRGATDFAYEQGLVVLPPDALIAPSAKERWRRWQQELQVAEHRERTKLGNYIPYQACYRRPVTASSAHLAHSSSAHIPSQPAPAFVPAYSEPVDPRLTCTTSSLPPAEPVRTLSDTSALRDGRYMDGMLPVSTANVSGSSPESSGETANKAADAIDCDYISDTVGAIAVDCWGNIAAGSSSGGIGMKHSGRIGPAALVGIGTCVIPVDPKDPEKTTVATVTSGTGEHIATTMAAHTCAMRIYYSQKKHADGTFEDVMEEEAMSSMISSDFMGHPGVRGSRCQAAIGIVAVKKTTHGIYLYFGHNTDSFVIASMSSEDKQPVCVMSRNNGNGSIAQGGRATRSKPMSHAK
ncbi:threonine aspartase 1 [Aspergillus homomorphus CBS 101889]|uniref:N-terminal nucleophile aminohydrolase n=1 Tax=Aspergillus homomorphus (strain CBS 101889) TaxID=1450537 RepID=A0A395I338_ASPHC|nr:N-terminal nucleophile aminohydrolase [Aspergillus homomorphus CBS 101889]RAL14023.1 N-terminal nucleophile aminohydrolase [Aspergillus homomorphus CBS 101889]